MTRSKFKEVVERGVVSVSIHHLSWSLSFSGSDRSSVYVHQVIPAWNISPIKKSSEAYKVRRPEVTNP